MLRRTITRLALVGLPLLSASGLAAQAAVSPATAPAAPVTAPHADSVTAMMPLARAFSALTTLRERADAEYAEPKNKKPEVLAELREDLARIGYARAEDSNEYEDHFSALCDVMRGLIGEAALSEEAAEQQQDFFQHYLAPWHGRLFEKVDQAAGADFYRKVARVADAFLTHETQYFELA